MKINSDINILGGLPDWHLITALMNEEFKSIQLRGERDTLTAIKTNRSVRRFENAIRNTLISFENKNVSELFTSIIENEKLNPRTLLILCWNASRNNELFNHLNERVYFPAFFSGRITIKKSEVEACIQELRNSETSIKSWTGETISLVATKYLTLLKKFGLMVGSVNKTIVHPFLDDPMLIIFVYWLVEITHPGNLLESKWLKYGFTDKQNLINRIIKPKFSKFYNTKYTFDSLYIETLIPYPELYSNVFKS